MYQVSDVFLPPNPDAGWSREILTIRKAHVWPAGVLKRIPTCGVTYPDGRDCPEEAIYRGDTRMMAKVTPAAAPTAKLAGRHLWGGQVFAHFGHFICESLNRLWAISKVDVESIVFIGKHEDLVRLSGWQERFMEYLGVDLPIVFLSEPSEVEELLIPGQGFGLGEIARGTPEFREFLQNIPKHIAPAGAEKIYISRTKTGKKGAILNEPSVERNLAREGYVAYHPQDHDMEAQLAQYLAATHIVGLDSSAFHLLGLVARPEQNIAILLRRNMMAYYNIQLQLEGMTGRRPDIINALVGDWIPPGQKRASRLSWGQVDHHRMVAELARRGYVAEPEKWDYPNEKRLARAMESLHKRLGQGVTFQPVDTPVNEMIDRRQMEPDDDFE